MANTVTRNERSTATRSSGANSPTYYRVLAVLLIMGALVAVGLGLMGQTGPGLMTPEAADMALFALVGLLVFVVALFLLRIGEILDVDRRVKGVLSEAYDREQAMRASYTQMQAEIQRLREAQKPLPMGDASQHVIMVEGIGPVFASRLNACGIITIDQLLAARPGDVAERIEATPELVSEWQDMARLMRIKGIGPQTAELLVRSGVRTPADLAKESPEHLATSIDEAFAGKKVKPTNMQVTPAIAKRWIEAARDHKEEPTRTTPSSPSFPT